MGLCQGGHGMLSLCPNRMHRLGTNEEDQTGQPSDTDYFTIAIKIVRVCYNCTSCKHHVRHTAHTIQIMYLLNTVLNTNGTKTKCNFAIEHTTRILVLLLIDVQSQSVNAEPQFASLLVFNVKIVDAVHFQVLCDLQILHHSVVPTRNGM